MDVVGAYIKVEKAGINYKAKCPFHNEKTASFFVSSTRQSFYCFGCGEKGDIFTFIEKFEGLDFKGALKVLADKAGIKLPKFSKQESGLDEKEERGILYKIIEEASLHFEENLKTNTEVRKYLQKRGLNGKEIEKWRIGFAKNEWRDLQDFLLNKGFSKKEMLAAGLLKEKDGKNYDTFRARIIFPISDSIGEVVAFSGRSFPDKEGTPKYLNSPETKIFHKSDTLYGWHLAKTAIRKLDYAVLVEGQFDLVLSHESGVLNTVASSGTALTPQHLQKIKKLSNRIIIAYDSDSAGEKAAQRAAELGLSLGMEVKIASLPPGEDPASLALKDKEQWKQYLRNAQHLIDFALNKVTRDKKGPSLLKEVERNILPYFNFIKSEIERSHFVRRIAEQIGVSEEAVIKEVARFQNAPKDFGKKLETESPINPEKMLAGLVFGEKDGKIREAWEKIVGKESVEEILQNFEAEKEALLFETEKNMPSGDEQLNKLQSDTLTRQLEILTKTLDKTNKEEQEKIKREIETILQILKSIKK